MEKEVKDYLPKYFESLSEVYQIIESERKNKKGDGND